MTRGFIGEILFWIAVFVGFSLAYTGFKPLFKLAVSHIPIDGLREAVAAS